MPEIFLERVPRDELPEPLREAWRKSMAARGNATANALQRGLWTHTRNALSYFDSITNGWIDYSHNHILVKLFSHALVSSEAGHGNGLEKIREDIKRLQRDSGMLSS